MIKSIKSLSHQYVLVLKSKKVMQSGILAPKIEGSITEISDLDDDKLITIFR